MPSGQNGGRGGVYNFSWTDGSQYWKTWRTPSKYYFSVLWALCVLTFFLCVTWCTTSAIRCHRGARCRPCSGKRLSSTRRGCRICVRVRFLVRPRETMYWQANANTPPSVTPPFKCARFVCFVTSSGDGRSEEACPHGGV